MSDETEFDYLSPYSDSDYVSIETDDDSLLISNIEGEEEITSSPDAISIEEPISEEEILPEIENWESVDVGSAAIIDSPVSSPGQVSIETDQGEKQTENFIGSDPVGSDTLSDIYKLLDERLPSEKSETESIEIESESEISENEITLSDIHDQIDSIAQFESEQLSIITEIRDNSVISNNNSYYLDSFQIALTSAIFGSILIGFLFRNIR